MPMTPQQRRNAALKAAATKKRNQAAARGGYAPPPTPPSNSNSPLRCHRCGAVYTGTHACPQVAPPPPNPWAPGAAPPPPAAHWTPGSRPQPTTVFGPKPTVENARAEVIVALENLYALVVKASGLTTERDDAFRKYKLALNTALGQLSNQAMQNEANAALCVAAIRLWKVTF
jgi:hypothetical protein